MRSLILLFILLFVSTVTNAQLKEFEINPLPKPEISLVQANTEFGEDALIIIYSSLTNLNFRSSMGMIDKQSYNPQSNRYEILVRPIKQILLVYSNEFMEGTISTINPKIKDVFYFKVEEKKTKLLNQSAPGKLSIKSIPEGANISLNGIPVSIKTPFTGDLNPGPTRIQLSKLKYQSIDTVIQVQSSINELLTINLKPSTLWLNIKSNPASANVELDGKIIGKTPLSKEFDLNENSKQGERILNVTLTDYTAVNQRIQLYPSKEPLSINIDLKKLEGDYKIESTPEGAEVFIDGEYRGHTPMQGTLPLGTYSVELKMEEYMPLSKKQIYINAEKTANLKENLIKKKQPIGNLGEDFEEGELINDASGNSYKTVQIGTQVWMGENLKTERYANGDLIPNVNGNFKWSNLKTAAWCNYDNSIQNEEIYGKLYNWYVVSDSRNVCPIGWHVPSDADWKILTDYLGGDQVAGGKMKINGNDYWKEVNLEATDEYGFKGLPAGGRGHIGAFDDIGYGAYWWSSTKSDSYKAWYRNLGFNNSSANRINVNKQSGFSIRCIKD